MATEATTPELEKTIDATLADTFPASDPPAWTLGREPQATPNSTPTLVNAQQDATGSEDNTKMVTILGIVGSLRRDSYNRATLRAAQHLLPANTALEICDLAGIPLFNQDDEQAPPTVVVEFKNRIRAADAILMATPEYNYSIPGVLKNAIDWASRPQDDNVWNDKPVAVLGASLGKLGTVRAQSHLRQVFVTLNMHPLNRPEVMIGNAGERFDATGNLTDKETQTLLQQLLDRLVLWTRQLQRVRS